MEADICAQERALRDAACEGEVETMQDLLDTGVNVNAQGGEFGNALQGASANGKVEAMLLLMDCGADVNAQGGKFGNALQAAAYHGNVEAVLILLRNHADVNAQGGDCVSGRYYSKFYLYHLVSKDIRSSYNNSVPISG